VNVVWERAVAVLQEAAAPSHVLFGTVQSASLLSSLGLTGRTELMRRPFICVRQATNQYRE
jgi:hypothetical protein